MGGREKLDDVGGKCWGDQDAKIGTARVALERDWPGHPSRRSLQLSQPTGLLGNDTPGGGAVFLTADPGSGVSKKKNHVNIHSCQGALGRSRPA